MTFKMTLKFYCCKYLSLIYSVPIGSKVGKFSGTKNKIYQTNINFSLSKIIISSTKMNISRT